MTSAVIVACGKGSRMKSDIPKQFYRLQGETVLYRSVKPFSESDLIDEIIIVTLPGYIGFCLEELKALPKVKKAVVGGDTRQQSVFNGLDAVDPDCALVAVHDAARPFVTEMEISTAILAAEGCAVAVGTRVSDTVKLVNADGFVESAPSREMLWAVQTPQVLPYEIFKAGRARAEKECISVTDDVSLASLMDFPVKIIEGSSDNIKITYDKDLIIASELLMRNSEKQGGG